MVSMDIANKLHEHQLLLFSSLEDKNFWWNAIKSKSSYQPFLKEIREEAEKLLQEQNQSELHYDLFQLFIKTGSRKEYEKVYFHKRRRLNTFAIMTLLEPENKIYLKELQNSIWSICNEYTWCLPAHLQESPETDAAIVYSINQLYKQDYTIDLFAAETAFALSEIYKLTEDYLDPLIGRRIYDEVYKRTFIPFKEGNFKWETETHNWSAVCAGSLGSAALHLIADNKELAIIIEKVLPCLEYYLSGFKKDGICMEGYSYWQYGFGFYLYFADLLKKKSNGELNLLTCEKIHQIALFQQRCFLEENLVVNFSDASATGKVLIGMTHYLHNLYPDVTIPKDSEKASFTEDFCSRWAPAIRSLLWYDESAVPQEWEKGQLFSKESQWIISRHQTSAGHFSFAAKGGHNDEPHNHNDIGHFILQGNKEVLLKDLGSGLYTKDYFNEKRYSYLCNGSQGHSVPIVNYFYQTEGVKHAATVINSSLHESIDCLELDIAAAYSDPTLYKLIRKFQWVKTEWPKLIVEDRYLFTKPADNITERFIMPVLPIRQYENGISLEGNQRLNIAFDRKQVYLDIQKLQFINHAAEKEEVLALDFTLLEMNRECSCRIEFEFAE